MRKTYTIPSRGVEREKMLKCISLITSDPTLSCKWILCTLALAQETHKKKKKSFFFQQFSWSASIVLIRSGHLLKIYLNLKHCFL